MIRHLILHLLANGIALYFISKISEGDFIITGGVAGYLVAALIFGILNSLVKPILKILSFPFMLLTAGLFTIVINMFLVWFAEYLLEVLAIEGIAIVVDKFITYLYVGILIGVANVIINWLTKK
jgi:putative membrane protein